jgi:hypothetical protein
MRPPLARPSPRTARLAGFPLFIPSRGPGDFDGWRHYRWPSPSARVGTDRIMQALEGRR